MSMDSVINISSKLIGSRFLSRNAKELILGRFIPHEDEIKKISDFLKKYSNDYFGNENNKLEARAALIEVPYLKYMKLEQIDYWMENCNCDLEVLFDLYVAQGFFHPGIRRLRWDDKDLNFHYVDFYNKVKIKSNFPVDPFYRVSYIFSCVIIVICMFFYFCFLPWYLFPLMALISSIFLFCVCIFGRIREIVVINATQRIIDKYPNLVNGLKV